MPDDIYVDIGPMDASKAPKEYAAKVKGYMESSVEKAVAKAKGFTTSKKGEGFTIRLKVAELKVVLTVRDQLTAKDPIYPKAGPFKVHPVKLEAGKTYQIDLTTTAVDSRSGIADAHAST